MLNSRRSHQRQARRRQQVLLIILLTCLAFIAARQTGIAIGRTIVPANGPSAEIEAAALQFVRKVSGYRKPSKANQAVFEQAVAEIAAATAHLLGNLNQPTKRSS